MIREAIGHALLLAAEAVGALPVSRQWERDLDELRQQIGDLDAAVADRDVMRGEKAASDEIGRLKAELARWVNEAWAVAKALAPYREETSAAFVSRATDVDALVAEWQKRGEDLEALRKELCATRSSLAHVLDCVSEARMQLDRDEVSKALDALDAVENGLVKAPSDLAIVPEPIDKAAALRAAGWRYKPHRGWALGVYGLGYLDTDDAYRAMVEDRERKKAATPRDTQPGDMFVDDFGRAYICDKAGTVKCISASEQAAMPNRFQRATPEEVAKFRKDHGL